jgi:hypothetical protein
VKEIKRSAYEAGFISDTELRKINRGELTGTKNKKELPELRNWSGGTELPAQPSLS